MSRLRPLLAIAGLALATPASATNYLVIVLDDLGADKVSGYADIMYPGYAPTYLPETPAMDTLADIGLRFSRAYVTPVCSPTRAALLTGEYPFQTDVSKALSASTDAHELSTDTTTLPEMLTGSTPDAAVSGLFGKWHLGVSTPGRSSWTTAGERSEAPAPALHGFSTYIGALDGDVASYYSWLETRWPEVLASGAVGSVNQTSTTWASDAPISDSVDWVATQPGAWFALVSLNAPHIDSDHGGADWELDDLAPEELGACVEMNGDHSCSNREIYATLVMDADARIDDLLVGLMADDPAHLADTVIIVLGDNGSQSNVLEAPWTPSGERTGGGKYTSYESGVRAPFIIARGCDWMDQADGRYDGLLDGGDPACADSTVPMATPGLTITAPIQIEDVYATIAELSGSVDPVPDASISLVPCLTATTATADDCGSGELHGRGIYTETFARPINATSAGGTTGPADSGNAAAIVDDYKIVATIASDVGAPCMRYHFFDLHTDPFETNDLRVGRGAMTASQSAGFAATWSYMRLTVAPDWFATRACATDTPWDTDHDTYEDITFGGLDCDDHDATVKPGAVDTWYDGIDGNCDGLDDFDQDHDGVHVPLVGGDDCDDTDPDIRPAVAEWCDGVDDNCDGLVDEGLISIFYADRDSDGYGTPEVMTGACAAPDGFVTNGSDCDDSTAVANPRAPEICNGADDNCDGSVDEGVTLTFYRDADGDGYGKSALTVFACAAPPGYTSSAGDCNDAKYQVHPGASDPWYDGRDTDCRGNDDFDRDGDGYASWKFGGTDCDDYTAAAHPGAEEVRADGRDSNCNRHDND